MKFINKSFDESLETGGVFLDMSEPFDEIKHKVVTAKRTKNR